MSLRIVYPVQISAARWCNEMSQGLAAIGQLPQVTSDEGWREWARVASRQFALAQYTPPMPDGYKDWLSWASAFIRALQPLGI